MPQTPDDSPGADPISGHHVMMGGKAGRAALTTLTRKQWIDRVAGTVPDKKAVIKQDGDTIKVTVLVPLADAVLSKLTAAGFNVTPGAHGTYTLS